MLSSSGSTKTSHSSQSDKFKDAAREAECDEDEARWKVRLQKIATQKLNDPEPRKSE